VWDWEAEKDYETPAVAWFWTPSVRPEGDGGAEVSGGMFREVDEIAIQVHVKADAGDVVKQLAKVQADIHKAILADRSLSGITGRVQVWHTRSGARYIGGESRDVLGGTMEVVLRVRYDHTAGSMVTDT
jgi:hypothetical protein